MVLGRRSLRRASPGATRRFRDRSGPLVRWASWNLDDRVGRHRPAGGYRYPVPGNRARRPRLTDRGGRPIVGPALRVGEDVELTDPDQWLNRTQAVSYWDTAAALLELASEAVNGLPA